MFWLFEVLIALVAIFTLALTGLLGKTAKRYSRKLIGKIWRGVKKHTHERWQARRNLSRGIKPKKKRPLKVLKSQPVIYRVSEKTYEPTVPQCGADTDKGTPCTRTRVVLKNGMILNHCWQHPPKKQKAKTA